MKSIEKYIGLVLSVVSVLVQEVQLRDTGFDNAYCQQQSWTTPKPTGYTWVTPAFNDNFGVLVEQKLKYTKTKKNLVTTTQLFLSKQNEVARLSVYGPEAIMDIWALANAGSLVEVPRSGDLAGTCNVLRLDQSTYGKFLSASSFNGTMAKLGYPAEVLQWSKGLQQSTFLKKTYLDDRGIFVDLVQTCNYDLQRDATSVANFYFSDPGKTKMAGDPKTSLIVRAEVTGQDNYDTPFNYAFGYDYANFRFGYSPTSSNEYQLFQDAYCLFPKSANTKQFPTMPDDFKVKIQKYIFDNYGGEGTSTVEHLENTFAKSLGVFVARTVGPGVDATDKARQTEVDTIVHDYTAGIQYIMDRIAGNCNAAPITKSDVDVNVVGKLVTMKSGNQFFGLNLTYQYLGVMQYRGIDCDVFTARYDKNTVVSWYFATDSWKSSHNYMPGKPVPVLMISRPNLGGVYEAYDFFQYTDDILFVMPDVSDCFDSDHVANIQFVVKGIYSQLVTPDVPSFRRAVAMALMANGQFLSSTRISRIDFYPWTRDTVLIQATLLDKLDIKGDAKFPSGDPSNEDIITSIQQQMDKEQFRLTVFRAVGKYDALGKRGSLRTFDPKTWQPDQPIDNTGVDTSNNQGGSGSGGYGAGDMAGLALGMVALTAVVTLLVVFLVYKFKMNPTAGDTVAMNRLPEA